MWREQGMLFGFHRFPISGDDPPNWFINRLNQQTYPTPDQPWWKLADFDPRVGDIKVVWELSRFDWVLAFAQQAVGGDPAGLQRLNTWLSDWATCNPPYLGPNWKCGQEASIRVLHLMLAAALLGELDLPEDRLKVFVFDHLARIAPTVAYAVGQANNHATSEAAALFMGGHWLRLQGIADGARWEALGHRWLENRAATLIQTDGTFSQYSVNYHRLMLDTYSLTLWWQQKHDLPPFSDRLQARVKAATEWLKAMVDPMTGDVPNIGANDGANLLPLTDADYRDYRPSLGLAERLLNGKQFASNVEVVRNHLAWLGLETPSRPLLDDAPTNARERPTDEVQAKIFDQGGFAVLRQGNLKLIFRYPRFRFRPSQCDALHVDFWIGSDNLLRDAGTFSYNCDPELQNYFNGPAGHNTIQFDGRDQMPKLSRFLYSDWLVTRDFEPLRETPREYQIQAGYRDRWGSSHTRTVTLTDEDLQVSDVVAGFAKNAVLRWHLPDTQWNLHKEPSDSGSESRFTLAGQTANVFITSSEPLQAKLVQGWESLYYGQKTSIPVLEITLTQAGRIDTQIVPKTCVGQ